MEKFSTIYILDTNQNSREILKSYLEEFNWSGEIRLYAASVSNGATEGDGTEINVSINGDKVIKSITITFTGGSYAKSCAISAGSNVVVTTDGSSVTVTVEINSSSFTIKNVAASGQVRFKSIEITYA